jgi:hypothetical protein
MTRNTFIIPPYTVKTMMEIKIISGTECYGRRWASSAFGGVVTILMQITAIMQANQLSVERSEPRSQDEFFQPGPGPKPGPEPGP